MIVILSLFENDVNIYVLYGAHLEYGKCFSLKIAVAGIQPLAVRRLLNATDVRYKA